jgi:hypothetical protein
MSHGILRVFINVLDEKKFVGPTVFFPEQSTLAQTIFFAGCLHELIAAKNCVATDLES